MDRVPLALPQPLRELPAPLRLAAVGAVLLGVVGGTVGLIVGLSVHPGTAWAAVVEVGLPAALLGGVLGLLVGSVAYAAHRHRGSPGG